MNICTFFGHTDAPYEIYPILEESLKELITHRDVSVFYVGVEGRFDEMCYKVLKSLRCEFPYIIIYRVYAYFPKHMESLEDSIYPEGIEQVPKRFAISWRNKWMIEKSNYAVTYVNRKFGGAYKFENMAIKKNLNVLNIASM